MHPAAFVERDERGTQSIRSLRGLPLITAPHFDLRREASFSKTHPQFPALADLHCDGRCEEHSCRADVEELDRRPGRLTDFHVAARNQPHACSTLWPLS